MTSNESAPAPKRRATGRPRRLDLTQVIQAGIDVGLENLGISAVAMKLGVSAAVIYTYVENLEQLRRLVVASLAKQPSLEDVGQHWSDIARTYVDNVYSILSKEPELLGQVLLGAVGPEEPLEQMETFMKLMGGRGFTAPEALDLYSGCGQIAIGAAAASAMAVARARRGIDARVETLRLLVDQPDDAFPHVRSLDPAEIGSSMSTDYRPALGRFLKSFAAERGEELPAETA